MTAKDVMELVNASLALRAECRNLAAQLEAKKINAPSLPPISAEPISDYSRLAFHRDDLANTLARPNR